MENTVKARVLLLKNNLNLSRLDFSNRAKISPSTLDNLLNGAKISPKIAAAFEDNLNVNRMWLLHGTGEMFKPAALEVAYKLGEEVIFENALIKQLSSENSRLQKEVERLWGILGNYLPAKQQTAGFKRLINQHKETALRLVA